MSSFARFNDWIYIDISTQSSAHTPWLDSVYHNVEKMYQEHSREYIWRGFRYFADTVLRMKPPSDSDAKNTFAASSLMYPPRLAWFTDDGPSPSNYVNMKEKIDWLNHKIDGLNIENDAAYYPCFHTYGTRKGSKLVTENGQMKKREFRCHRWDHWQESVRHMKATLKPERLFKMGQAVNNYFLHRTWTFWHFGFYASSKCLPKYHLLH